MDTFTHALSGALIARLTAPSPQPGLTIPLGRRMALGMLAAAAPDLDFVLGWLPPASYLLYHRGVTHSILLLPVWSLIFAWLCAKIWRRGPDWRAYFSVFAWGIGIHIVGDWITSFGTMFLAPLSDRRFALSTTFIIDLWLTFFVLAGTVACFFWRASRLPAAAALCAVAGYIAFQGWQHDIAVDFGERYARTQGLPDARVSAVPRPVSPFNWTVMVEDDERVHRADVRLTTEPALLAMLGVPFIGRLAAPYAQRGDAQWTRRERFGSDAATSAVRAALATPELAYFRWFADHPVLYRIDRGNPSTCIWFEDLRFVTPGREAVPFRHGVCREAQGPWAAYALDGDRRVRAR
jgi:inner membrane protein